MERLTELYTSNVPEEVLKELEIENVPKEDYEIIGTNHDTCKETCEKHNCLNCPIKRAIDKLAEYEDLEEQGLLLKLPCAIGTTVYEVTNHGIKGHWDEHRWIVDEWSGWIVRERIFNLFMLADGVLGKTVFLTEQEAQAALEEMKGE